MNRTPQIWVQEFVTEDNGTLSSEKPLPTSRFRSSLGKTCVWKTRCSTLWIFRPITLSFISCRDPGRLDCFCVIVVRFVIGFGGFGLEGHNDDSLRGGMCLRPEFLGAVGKGWMTWTRIGVHV